jgi:hypothetical protein
MEIHQASVTVAQETKGSLFPDASPSPPFFLFGEHHFHILLARDFPGNFRAASKMDFSDNINA